MTCSARKGIETVPVPRPLLTELHEGNLPATPHEIGRMDHFNEHTLSPITTVTRLKNPKNVPSPLACCRR